MNESRVFWWLFGVSALAGLLHFADNFARIAVYPEPDWLTRPYLVAIAVSVLLAAIAGFVWFRRSRFPQAFYALYLYCALNLLALWHYAHAPFSAISFSIHLFILLEVATAVVFGLYVAHVHRVWRRYDRIEP